MSVTMKDVARAAGVSVMTVSRAFREDSSIRPKTRAAIRKAADELGYVFDSTAATFRTQKTGFVGVTIPSINNANFAATVAGLSDALSGQGLQVLLSATNYDTAQEEQAIEQLLRRRPEAIVLTGGRHTDRARKLLQAADIPVIETWDRPQEPIGHVVGFSNADIMADLVDHLVARRFTRIAFIGGDARAKTRGADRRTGFVEALSSHGLEAVSLVEAGVPPISMREGAKAMAHLLDTQPRPEAVVCVTDLLAFGALCECQRRGLNVPRDIALAGFGAYEVAEVCVPALTTIDPYPARIGAEAAGIITAARSGAMPAQTRLIAPRLITAPSTAV